MNLGTTIKKLRQQRDMTQEKLAEYLNVSISAVSQWESKKTVPDVFLLPAIADFFDISLDALFGRTSAEKKNQIKAYEELSLKYKNKGEVSKDIAIWREAVKKYPGNFTCLGNLADALFMSLHSDCENDRVEENAKECIAISKRILQDCKDSNLRNSTIQKLVFLYSDKYLSLANENKAVEYAMMASNVYCCRENLLASAYFTEANKEKQLQIKHENILTYMDLLTMNLYYGNYESNEDKIKACLAALTLWETLIYDGNYLFYHNRIQTIYSILAYCYAEQINRTETIEALKRALYHAEQVDNSLDGDQHYTSIFVSAATSDTSKCTKNYNDSNTDTVLHFMKQKEFDFLRNDEEFMALGKQ